MKNRSVAAGIRMACLPRTSENIAEIDKRTANAARTNGYAYQGCDLWVLHVDLFCLLRAGLGTNHRIKIKSNQITPSVKSGSNQIKSNRDLI